MTFIKYLYNLESGSVCIYPDYSNKIQNKDLFPETITYELSNILERYGEGDHKFIVLVDLTKIQMNSEQAGKNIFFYKKLKDHLENKFPNKLEKIIIYDYTEKTIFLLNILKLILDRELRNKIIINKDYKVFINTKIISDINVSNNGLHC
jgi:hypothetical protein